MTIWLKTLLFHLERRGKITGVFSSEDNNKAAEVFDAMVIEEAQNTA